jgi:glycosyltransferase involved in cell wall biosynthesis
MIRELARAMDRLATDPDHAERLSRNARAIAERNFPWKDVAQSWMTAGYVRRPAA